MIIENVMDVMNRINENITISKLVYRSKIKQGEFRGDTLYKIYK